jgi:hypothetical protein
MWVGSWAADFPPFTLLSVSLDACEKAQDVSFRSESEIYNLCPGPVFSSGESSPRHFYLRPHTNVLLFGRTPLFLSRLLTRVPIQSFERWVGGRALGGSRNFEVSPIQSVKKHELFKEGNTIINCNGRIQGHHNQLLSGL